MIALTQQYDPATAGIFAAGGLLMAVGVALGCLWQQHLANRANRRSAQQLPREDHSAAMCGASGIEVDDVLVSLDGHLFGLCPGCGKSHTPCSQIDHYLPHGPWVIDAHVPFIDPDVGLHDGPCWTAKYRTRDFGLCTCGQVAA